ncbi:unnamed protein product [Withania somnifera]
MTIIVTIFLILLPLFLLLVRGRGSLKRVPPGSLGFPIIGQSLGMLRAMRANTAEKWIEERAANKFVFTSDASILTNQQTQSVKMILGDRCLLELNGEDHKRVRDALVSFLKPDRLKRYVGKMEEEVRIHLEAYWKDEQIIKVLPLMKTLTFNIICSLLFGLEHGARRDQMVQYFQQMMEGMWSIPINMPFTRFNHSLKASKDVQKMLQQLISEKRHQLENNLDSFHQDLITCLLSNRGENNQELISENEIIHNVMLIMVAGHDNSSILITFIVRLLAKDPNIHAAVLKGMNPTEFHVTHSTFTVSSEITCGSTKQEEIAQSESPGESLTWEDLGKMKYTWRVAMETLRMFPPIFGGFRKTVKDIEYGGYLIPKGWKNTYEQRIFQKPEKFDPARFVKPGSLPPYNFVPFGGGAQTLVTIHYLVTHFTWKLRCTDDFFSRDPMAAPTQGLPVQIIPRKPI